ncbi:MAG: methyl-accepting chemotaxis protein [Candidatus Accumulibacter sp.]|nr:methyl-accepting chemotaxis protein [Accumulibacter sp.]
MAQQILIGVAVCSVVMAAVIATVLSHYSQGLALNESKSTLQTQAALVTNVARYAQANMQQSALAANDRFRNELPPLRATGGTVSVNGVTLPEFLFGDIPSVGNQKYLLDYQKRDPSANVAWMIIDKGRLYRSTTLLKREDGSYDDGAEITDAYAATVLAGKPYVGSIVRAGKMYALAVVPVSDESGKRVVAVSMRVPVDDAMKELRGNLGSIVIGKTGYPFILSRPVGDRKDPFLVVHKDHQGKAIKDIDAASSRVLAEILEQKTGYLIYDWKTESGASQRRLAAFQEFPELGWVVAVAAPLEEFTAPYDTVQRWMLIGIAALVLAAMLCIGLFVRWQLRPLNETTRVVARVAENLDLTHRIGSTAGDEIGTLARSFDSMVDSVQQSVRAIGEEVAKVGATVEAVNAAAEQVARGSASQSGSTSAMAAAIEQMTVSINTVATSASDAQTMAQRARGVSEEGSRIIEDTQSKMSAIAGVVSEASKVFAALSEESRQISSVVNVIKEVSDQTNLLALNAAIEAARSGEQGRGFAVVADEVRKLAERTAQSTGDISGMIGNIQSSANSAMMEMEKVVGQVAVGQSLVQEAGERMKTIHEESSKVSNAVTEISNALKEQGVASQEVARRVESISQMAEENNAAVGEAAVNTEKLDELAKAVKTTLKRFRV